MKEARLPVLVVRLKAKERSTTAGAMFSTLLPPRRRSTSDDAHHGRISPGLKALDFFCAPRRRVFTVGGVPAVIAVDLSAPPEWS
jgi:hypothetical protein